MKLHLYYYYFLFLTLLIILQSKKATSAACHPDDESGLLSFKSGITQDPSGILSSWIAGTDCCKWNGITCLTGPRVTAISLYGSKPNGFLSGTISPNLAKLKHLGGIYLIDTQNISGRFPDFLFKLPEITYIYIENNKLSGQIPANIGKLTKLYALSLMGNRFAGPIPASISGLTGLGQLRLGNNLLTGTIPTGIGKLANLTQLSLENNKLSGQIPDIFKPLTSLIFLTLSHNNFTGQIPPSIETLSQHLRFLELGHNSLSGKIPSFLGKFQTLDTLNLSKNRFTGTVPTTFKNLTKIFNLDLSHNALIDPFPQLAVKGIESLDLSYNNFHLNQIPKWVTSSPIIFSLKLAKCGLKFKLDDWNPTETYFYDFIDLSENEISGSPVNLINRTEYLKEFKASGNKLKFDIGKLKIGDKLKRLDLSRNLVFGKLPVNISKVENLNVSYNHLCGKIPPLKSPLPASAFVGNDCLCGPPLQPCKA